MFYQKKLNFILLIYKKNNHKNKIIHHKKFSVVEQMDYYSKKRQLNFLKSVCLNLKEMYNGDHFSLLLIKGTFYEK